MSVSVIFKTEKPDGAPQFCGQVQEPVSLKKASEIAGKVTGEVRTGATCIGGTPITVTTKNHFVDFLSKRDYIDLKNS